MSESNEKPSYVYEAEAAKLNAEAERATAEALAARQESIANARRLDAETARLQAERMHIAAEHHKLDLDNQILSLSVENKLREDREEKSQNKYRNIYYFASDVDGSSVNSCIKQLDIWKYSSGREPLDNPMSIIFTSPGGSILHGLVLFDYIQKLRRDGHVITTGTYGIAASMAGILLQAGDVRWMSKESWLLIHEAAFMAMGKMGEVEDTTIWIKRIQGRILDIFADRADERLTSQGMSREFDIKAYSLDEQPRHVTLMDKATLRQFIADSWRRKDWWLSSDEAYRYGLIDEVR